MLLLLDEVRGKTLRILKSVPEENARWAPAGLDNTILWHAGHAYVLVESLAMRSLERTPLVPDGWSEMFSPGSRPSLVAPDRWPSLSAVIGHLEAQHRRLLALISQLSEEQLDRPSAGNPKRTVHSVILHCLHDEACHCGEMYLLFKLQVAARRL
jgi:hypothetical protein